MLGWFKFRRRFWVLSPRLGDFLSCDQIMVMRVISRCNGGRYVRSGYCTGIAREEESG